MIVSPLAKKADWSTHKLVIVLTLIGILSRIYGQPEVTPVATNAATTVAVVPPGSPDASNLNYHRPLQTPTNSTDIEKLAKATAVAAAAAAVAAATANNVNIKGTHLNGNHLLTSKKQDNKRLENVLTPGILPSPPTLASFSPSPPTGFTLQYKLTATTQSAALALTPNTYYAILCGGQGGLDNYASFGVGAGSSGGLGGCIEAQFSLETTTTLYAFVGSSGQKSFVNVGDYANQYATPVAGHNGGGTCPGTGGGAGGGASDLRTIADDLTSRILVAGGGGGAGGTYFPNSGYPAGTPGGAGGGIVGGTGGVPAPNTCGPGFGGDQTYVDNAWSRGGTLFFPSNVGTLGQGGTCKDNGGAGGGGYYGGGGGCAAGGGGGSSYAAGSFGSSGLTLISNNQGINIGDGYIYVYSQSAPVATTIVTQDFTTPGIHTFTVPGGVTSVKTKLWGGGGGGGAYLVNGKYAYAGGSGGFTFCELPVIAGQLLIVVVGGGGSASIGQLNPGGLGGGGSGQSGDNNAGAGGGGGRSAVQLTDGTDVVTAGGGGGGGGNENGSWQGLNGGGCGGGLNGCSAIDGNPVVGGGGTQLAGGVGGDTNYGGWSNGAAGLQYQGGNSGNYGGGGGGGYYGGGGGGVYGGNIGSGGGGSSFINNAECIAGYTIAGASGWSNSAVPSGGSNDAAYVQGSGVGIGGFGTVDAGTPPGFGGNGRVLFELSSAPTSAPSFAPSETPSFVPSATPTTETPSATPSFSPSVSPSMTPTYPPSRAPRTCPKGFIVIKRFNKCYSVQILRTSWYAANAFCSSRHRRGHLLTVDSAEEEDYVYQDLLRNYNVTVWTGLNRVDKPSTLSADPSNFQWYLTGSRLVMDAGWRGHQLDLTVPTGLATHDFNCVAWEFSDAVNDYWKLCSCSNQRVNYSFVEGFVCQFDLPIVL